MINKDIENLREMASLNVKVILKYVLMTLLKV